MNDHDMVEQARSGNNQAFQELIAKHYRTVQKFAHQIGVNRSEVEDITQDVFLNVYRSLSSFTGNTFTTWLYAVTLNAARDHMRREKRQRRNVEAVMEKRTTKPYAELGSSEASWELHDMILRLEEKYRIPLILHYFHEQSFKEIGEVLEKSETAVKTRVMRARKQLKKEWEKVGVEA
ncbi:RNA polymerase sigma factor [Salibacterium lacus]|uniref:RNA polymerase sigma factor n=1 Tax=Salibacterium lacus TaxID=1898109 RepID=A0ABW5T521_9BACI